MRVIWVAGMSDCEFELTADIARHPEIDLTYMVITDPMDQNNDFHMSQITWAPNVKIVTVMLEEKEHALRAVAAMKADLIIFRHPVWIQNKEEARLFASILKDQPLVIWTWEWVPNYALLQMPLLDVWPRIAVTNSQDFNRCKKSFPNAQRLILPFGIVRRTPEELIFEPRYAINGGDGVVLVSDAQPHYDCNEYGGIKRRSVEIMVESVLDWKPILWGNRYGQVTSCDWLHNPKFAPFVAGTYPTMDYPKVYSSSNIYLGVSWNAPTGGYSIRFARALSCGIPTIWEETVGRELDFEDQDIVLWSATPEDTRKHVTRLVNDIEFRLQLGERGLKYAQDHWEWAYLLNKLSHEVQ